MASKRMFDKQIVDSDLFLDMPLSAQALYFHLGMRADDDGFLDNCRRIIKLLDCKEDDLKILIMKGYVIPLEDRVMVITHWKINNYIRGDRYKPTLFIEELNKLDTDENGIYSFKTEEQLSLINQEETFGIPMVDHMVDTDKVSIGKNSTDKSRVEENREEKKDVAKATKETSDKNRSKPTKKEKVKSLRPLYQDTFDMLFNMYPRRDGKDVAFVSLLTLILEGDLEPSIENFKMISEKIKIMSATKQWQDLKFVPMFSTWLNQKRYLDDINEEDVMKEQLKGSPALMAMLKRRNQ